MTNPCKTCGHDETKHIYCEGACRPGFVCEAKCEKFVSGSTTQDEATRLAEDYATDKESHTVSNWQKTAFIAGYSARDAEIETANNIYIMKLELRIRELESALAFYADKDNWDMNHTSPTIWDDGSIDLGNRARKAIEGAGRDEEGK